jgi:hypothetical protein
MTPADKATLDELSDLLELLHTDGTIHDLDQWPEDRPSSTLGRVLCQLLHEHDGLKKTDEALKQLHELQMQDNDAIFVLCPNSASDIGDCWDVLDVMSIIRDSYDHIVISTAKTIHEAVQQALI